MLILVLLAVLVVIMEPCAGGSLPSGFTYLPDVDPSIIVEMRYYTMHNFIGSPIMGYDTPQCILTNQAAAALKVIQAALLPQNYSLKVYDCYRPQMAVDEFVLWSGDPDLLMKNEFYPELDKDQLFPGGYIAANSSHSRGSTVDLTIITLPPGPQATYERGVTTLIPCYAPQEKRFLDNSLDMGTGFDCFSPIANTNSTEISATQMQNRMLLQGAMVEGGFNSYAYEWWHFTLNHEPFPDTYFNFPIQ